MSEQVKLKVGRKYKMQGGGWALITGEMPHGFSHYPGLPTRRRYFEGVTNAGREMTWPEDGDANTCEYHDFSDFTLVQELERLD